MEGEFVFLTEKEAIWAEMLLEALRDNDVPCASMPVLGAAFSMRTGIPERLQIFVPEEKLVPARELMAVLFPAD